MTAPDDGKMEAERRAVAVFFNRLRSLAGHKDAVQCDQFWLERMGCT